MSIEQVIKEIKTQLSSINPLTIHHSSRDTFLLANKYQFLCIHLLAIIQFSELDNCYELI